MPATRSLVDAQRLVTAIQEAGGRAPKVLVNILAVADLLNDQSMPSDPARDIVRAGADGSLTDKKLAVMLADAAQRQQVVTYTRDLQQRVEPLLMREFHAALKAGAADEAIDSMRPGWDEHVAEIQKARAVIPVESSTDHFLASTTDPDAIAMWQGLNEHPGFIQKVAAVVSMFGPRIGPFPMIREYANSDGHLLEDRAIMATDGPIVLDSSVFRRPNPAGHRTSPWFRLQLRLHSVASAQERYDSWAADCWDSQYAGQQESWIDEDGVAHEKPRPTNPFRAKASVR